MKVIASETEARLAEAALRKRFSRGRSALARALDYTLLRLMLLAGAYLYFSGAVEKTGAALLLSLLFLALCMVVLRIVREVRYDRFVRRETARVKQLLLTDRLLLLPVRRIRELCGPLCAPGETPVLLPCTGQAGPDEVVQALRSSRSKGPLALFAMAGFTGEARSLLLRTGNRARAMDPGPLRKAAAEAGLPPTDGDVRTYLANLARQEQALRKSRRTLRLDGGYGGKYLLTGLLLTGLSFLTRYGLYYRLLAGVCMTIGGLSLYGRERKRAE